MAYNAVQMKEMEEAPADLEKVNAQLKEELQETDLQNQVKDIVNTVICNSLQETFNGGLRKCLKSNESLEDEPAVSNTQVVNQESKLTESAYLLGEPREKYQMYEEKASMLTLQLDKAKTAMGILNSELVLKEQQIETMEMRRKEKIRRLVDEANEKTMKEEIKMSPLNK